VAAELARLEAMDLVPKEEVEELGFNTQLPELPCIMLVVAADQWPLEPRALEGQVEGQMDLQAQPGLLLQQTQAAEVVELAVALVLLVEMVDQEL